MGRYDRYRSHITRDRSEKSADLLDSRRKLYDIYVCDYCPKEFRHEFSSGRDRLLREVADHMEEEHPDEVSRDEYPYEEVFREWVERLPFGSIREPDEPGDPIVCQYGEMKEVRLHSDGTVTLRKYKHIGGGNDDTEVRLEGKRLVVETGRKKSYISDRAFPIEGL